MCEPERIEQKRGILRRGQAPYDKIEARKIKECKVLFDLEVLILLARWTTVQRLRDLRPGEVIKDEYVPGS